MEEIQRQLKTLNQKLDTIMAVIEKLWPGLIRKVK